MHAAHAAEGWLRRRVGFQTSLLALGLGSLAKLSIWDSLEQQWRLQGALARVAALRAPTVNHSRTQRWQKITDSR